MMIGDKLHSTRGSLTLWMKIKIVGALFWRQPLMATIASIEHNFERGFLSFVLGLFALPWICAYLPDGAPSAFAEGVVLAPRWDSAWGWAGSTWSLLSAVSMLRGASALAAHGISLFWATPYAGSMLPNALRCSARLHWIWAKIRAARAPRESLARQALSLPWLALGSLATLDFVAASALGIGSCAYAFVNALGMGLGGKPGNIAMDLLGVAMLLRYGILPNWGGKSLGAFKSFAATVFSKGNTPGAPSLSERLALARKNMFDGMLSRVDGWGALTDIEAAELESQADGADLPSNPSKRL